MIFGVASVIAMLAIAEGAGLEARRQIAALGATNVIIRSSKPADDLNPSKQQDNDSDIFKYGVTRPWSPVFVFLIAVSIGVIFGIYPARCAAMLEAVEALRTE